MSKPHTTELATKPMPRLRLADLVKRARFSEEHDTPAAGGEDDDRATIPTPIVTQAELAARRTQR